jgi:hypothetical protein
MVGWQSVIKFVCIVSWNRVRPVPERKSRPDAYWRRDDIFFGPAVVSLVKERSITTDNVYSNTFIPVVSELCKVGAPLIFCQMSSDRPSQCWNYLRAALTHIHHFFLQALESYGLASCCPVYDRTKRRHLSPIIQVLYRTKQGFSRTIVKALHSRKQS